jgi:hypothetical protein
MKQASPPNVVLIEPQLAHRPDGVPENAHRSWDGRTKRPSYCLSQTAKWCTPCRPEKQSSKTVFFYTNPYTDLLFDQYEF